MTDLIRIKSMAFPDKYTVRFVLTVDGALRRIVKDDFYAAYSVPIQTIPQQILYIPLLSSLLPLTWVFDAELQIDVIDAVYHDAITKVKKAMADMYPGLSFGGQLTVGSIAATETKSVASRKMSLFSGGADSIATAVRHSEADLSLVTIWGVDIGTKDKKAWDATRRRVQNYADTHGLSADYVTCNFREFIDVRHLDNRFRASIGHWYRFICGPALLGVTAPLTYLNSASTVFIPATHFRGFDYPWGSSPRIDNHVRWSGVRAVHDGYDLTRTEKLAVIDQAWPDQPLLVCVVGTGFSGRNCGRCEKCSRTIAGLAVTGIDPRRHDLPVDATTFDGIRHAFEHDVFAVSESTVCFWRDIQDRIADRPTIDLTGSDAFFDWLSTVDLNAMQARSKPRHTGVRRLLGTLACMLPRPLRMLAKRSYYAVFRDY